MKNSRSNGPRPGGRGPSSTRGRDSRPEGRPASPGKPARGKSAGAKPGFAEKPGGRPARGGAGGKAPYGAKAAGDARGPKRGPAREGERAGTRTGAQRQERQESRPLRAQAPQRRSAAAELGLEDESPVVRSGGRPVNKHHLLYGIHAVAAAWANPGRTCRTLWVTESGLEALDDAMGTAMEAELDRPEPTLVEKDALDKLLPPGAVHQGVALDCAPLPEVAIEDIVIAAQNDPNALVVVLDQVTDPHNVGAIIRSAAAFGAKAVVVQDRHAPPLTGTLAKTASGGVEVVPLVRVTNLARAIDELKQASFWSVGLDEGGARPLHQVDLTGRTAIVLGSEGEGLRRLTAERCDEVAKLPTGGPVGSLNVSNAAAVALYEVARRR